MTRVKSILGLFLLVLATACSNIQQERKIEFVYLALGASDVMGVGATPLTEGYAYLVSRDLEEHVPGTFLINLGIPGARIDALSEQVRLAKHFGGEADVATVWVGANDLVHGVGPSRFQSDLRQLLRRLQTSLSKTVVIATLPDLTRLAAFGATPNPAVTEARVQAFNRAIEVEAPYVRVPPSWISFTTRRLMILPLMKMGFILRRPAIDAWPIYLRRPYSSGWGCIVPRTKLPHNAARPGQSPASPFTISRTFPLIRPLLPHRKRAYNMPRGEPFDARRSQHEASRHHRPSLCCIAADGGL